MQSNTLVLLGPRGSFSDEAADVMAPNFKRRYVSSLRAIFTQVHKGDFGLVPVHNKIVGDIPGVRHFLRSRKFKILKRFRMEISFVLAAKNPGAFSGFSGIKKIYVSKIARQQCEKFIGEKCAHAQIFDRFNSTSAAFKKIVQLKGGSTAAIGSAMAAKIYKLTVLARDIQDVQSDWTEFVLFSSRAPQRKTRQPRR